MASSYGEVGAVGNPQQFLSVLLLLSLCASPALPGIEAAGAFEEAVPVPVPTLSDYFNGETETQKSGVFDEEGSLPYDTSHLEYQQQQELQQTQQQLQQQMQQQLQQQKQLGKQQEGQRKQQPLSNQQTVEGGVAYEQGVHAQGVSVDCEYQPYQQAKPVTAQDASDRRPVLKGHGYFLLGILMMFLLVNVAKVNPYGKELTFAGGVRVNPLTTEKLLSSLLVSILTLTSPFFLIVGAVRLVRTLPSYLRWAIKHDEVAFAKVIAVSLCVAFYLEGPWGKMRPL
ncbi:hypothetical protein Emed_003027 [Eimeria media]